MDSKTPLKLHLVAFDVPYPPNYGGIVVVFYHLKSLKELGISITLHCFKYDNNPESDKLKEFCDEIHYYERKKSFWKQFSRTPFIVNTRMPQRLFENLSKDQHPIFFEGIHTTGFVTHPSLAKRTKIIRMHNIEWAYYRSLKEIDVDNWKRIFFHQESKKLKKYEKRIIKAAQLVLCLSSTDTKYYQEQNENTHYIPAFHPNTKVNSKLGTGDYALFHGKLSVPDNERAVNFLLDEVFSKTKFPFKIAGLNAPEGLKNKIEQLESVTLIENPSSSEMLDLIKNAQINLLWSFQSNGLKLKLLHSLFNGRHCLVNDHMVSEDENLTQLCSIANSKEEMVKRLNQLKNLPFTENLIEKRTKVIEKCFNNEENAKKTVDLIKKSTFNKN